MYLLVHTPFQIEKPQMGIHARVGRASGQKLFHNAKIIEDFQGSGLHSLAPGSRECFGGLVDDSKGHPAPGKVAGKRKTRRPGADNDDVCMIGISVWRGHGCLPINKGLMKLVTFKRARS
jgi:hypothetical protein